MLSPRSIRPLELFPFLLALLCMAIPTVGRAQDEPDDEEPIPGEEPPITSPRFTTASGAPSNATFSGSLQVVRAPSSAGGSSKSAGPEIFPEASRVWMSVRDVDPVPIERARRGGGWLCTKASCQTQPGTLGASNEGDAILRSIKLQTPTLPLPVTIWRRIQGAGKLDFDPVLLTRRSYNHVCAYEPLVVDGQKTQTKKDPNDVELCHDGTPAAPEPDSAELMVGLEWPRQAELAGFRYLAIVDACGNARVQPYQRSFTVPVYEVASGGCGRPDGRVLRVFPNGSFLRVTAFNIEEPASGDVMNVTYRVSVPPLENYSDVEPAKLLFPDFKQNDLKIDCGPALRKGPVDALGRPKPPPGGPPHMSGSAPFKTPAPGAEPKEDKDKKKKPPGPDSPDGPDGIGPRIDPDSVNPLVAPQPDDGTGAAPPIGPAPPGAPPGAGAGAGAGAGGSPDAAGDAASPAAKAKPGAIGPRPGVPPGAKGPVGPTRADGPPPPTIKPDEDEPGPQSLDYGSLVIAPEPLAQGNCRINLLGATKQRLVAPLALRVRLLRTDVSTRGGGPAEMLTPEQSIWIVTPNDSEFQLPALTEGFDGESRLRLVVESNPLSPDGKVVLLGDAGRVAAVMHSDDAGADPERARRTVGAISIHTVPLCGESNFERLDQAGNCLRAYLTVPAMLATLQITRAPWLEKPLITRSVLSAVGVALAFDSYDPVERSAFPIAAQVGGFVQNLDADKLGLMAYVGVAPTLPILGDGGNTTSFGFLAGTGISYVTNADGPDEGFKPTAFIAVVVQVGQASPEMSASGSASFGTYQGE